MKVKKQHFVPRFYLKNFSLEGNRIWVYDKDKKKHFASSIQNVACERYFYDDQKLDNKKNKEQYLENHFSEIESTIAPIYVRLIDNLKNSDEYIISESIREIFAKYLVTQIDRTRVHREEALQFTKESYAQLKEKGVTEEQIIQLGFDNNQFNKKELHLESIIIGDEMNETFAEILNDHIWIIYKNETSQSFYTSDQPIVKYGHINNELLSNEGYCSHGIEIAYPLDPNYILILCDREYFHNYEILENKISKITSIDTVKFYNSLQVISCFRQIFSNENNFDIVKEISKTTPTAFNINRKRVG